MIKNFLRKIKEHRLFVWFAVFYIIAVSVAQYLIIEVSAHGIGEMLAVSIKYVIIGIITVLTLNVIFLLIFKRINISLSIVAFTTTILSVANYYVYKFHGTPLNIDLLKNVTTALNVLDAYRFDVPWFMAGIIIFCFLQLIFVNIMFNRIIFKRKYSAVTMAICAVVMYISYFNNNPLVSKDIVNWSWEESLSIAGYTPCIVQSTQKSFNAIQKPEYYNEEELKEFVQQYPERPENKNTPDIIVILNETFYDLTKVADIDATQDSFEYIKNLSNSHTGYAVVPSVIGGTNKSEYELMTSNSLKITSNITPFNNINMFETNTIVSYLENLGYSTMALHPATGGNYRRQTVYRDIGFDYIYFEQDFNNIEYIQSRPFTSDRTVYKNMIEWYEKMGDIPRFAFVLTLQNHAGYKFNQEDENIIKAVNDIGVHDMETDEFLTCMYESNRAFEMLVEYFSNVDRDVIVCMVGDHAPSFAVDIVDEKYQSEKELRLRSVPYVIWSNNIDLSKHSAQPLTSLINLVPTTLEIAGMDLSGYYDYINKYSEEVPVITTYGDYITKDGEVYSYEDTTPYTEMINRYLELDYANIQKKDFMKQFGR